MSSIHHFGLSFCLAEVGLATQEKFARTNRQQVEKICVFFCANENFKKSFYKLTDLNLGAILKTLFLTNLLYPI